MGGETLGIWMIGLTVIALPRYPASYLTHILEVTPGLNEILASLADQKSTFFSIQKMSRPIDLCRIPRIWYPWVRHIHDIQAPSPAQAEASSPWNLRSMGKVPRYALRCDKLL